MVVRIAANLQELKQNLAEGRNQVETTTAAMGRLASSFRGDRLVQQAHNVAAAVQEIGGASRLTEAEQARVNRVVEAALEKYRLLGQQAPQALRDLAAQTHQATEKTSVLTRGVQALIAAFSVRAIIRAAGYVLEFTGNLTDLSAKAGISTEALQRLGYVTSQSGVSLEQIASGAVLLAKNLVGGNDSATKAVEALGLSVQSLIAQGPERAFLSIGEAIAKVPNPMEQAALATALFGRAGGDYLPAFTANMTALADQAQASGTILSEDLVRAGDEAGDAITRMKAAGMAVLAQFFIPMLPAVEAVANWLGTALPAALQTARGGIDALIRSGLEMKAWLLDMAVTVAQTVADVPVLGRVFGESSGDIDRMKQSAQAARDMLNSFNAQGVQPVKEGARAAIPVVTNFGEAMSEAGRKGKKAGEDLHIITGELDNITRFQIAGILNPQLTDFQTHTGNAEQAMQDLADTMARVEQRAIQIGPPLVNSMKLPWVEAKAAVQEAKPEVDGFFTRVFGGATELGSSVSSIFQAAFIGGGGALGAVQSFATQALSNLLGMIPGVGQFVSAFAGPIVAMFGRLISKTREFFRELFGGPSRTELNERNLVAEWEDQVIASSVAAQNETERWRAVVVAVRDAYLANGRTAEEAERDVARLWASSREGGEAAQAVIDEVNRKMHEQGEAAAAAVDRVGAALDGLPDVIDIEIRGNYRAPDLPRERAEGYAAGTMGVHGNWFRDFGHATATVLHGREAVVTPQQAPAFARAVLGSGGSDNELKALIRDLPRQLKTAMMEVAVRT